MKLQLYNDDDFKIIQEWITDEKLMQRKCANLIPYPLEQNGFNNTMNTIKEKNERAKKYS